MARITQPLTNTEVKQAKPKDKVYTLSDGGGLQLRVKPNGSKLWLLDYQRPYTKKRTSLSLGSYPIVTLALARSKKDEAKKLLFNNIDAIKPIAAKGSLEKVKRLCHRLNEIMLYAVNVRLINATPHWNQ